MSQVESLTDHQLREALKHYGQSPGPITNSTRNLYRKKLASLMEQADLGNKSKLGTSILHSNDLDDDDDTDEDYIVQDEDEDEEEEEEEDDEDEESEEEEDGDDVKLSSTTFENNDTLTTPDTIANRISRGIQTMLVSFFIAIFSFYLYSTGNYKMFVTAQPYMNITKLLLVFLTLSPIVCIIYKTFCFYKQRRDAETQRICCLVNEALEILQSPDNPNGLMPILHIRDTLLTPAERKTKKMINLWTKAVKFMEENESRVKVELVNVDGEDFRAWKWIGSRKP